ncbi:MAG: pilus assembly protein [Actinomycetota bacterium]|nr:pilus assembly protein [Actinomycetota bacterium]
MASERGLGESGEATTEAVLVVPVLMLLIVLVLQFGLWYHAEHVAQAAAQEGVRAARVEGGTAERGRQRTEDFLSRAGRTIVTGRTIDATRDPDTASVRVRGRAVAVVPGLALAVSASATSPVERFRP